jgi:hypothetical protein
MRGITVSCSPRAGGTFQTGTHSDAIKMRYADYERLAKPTVADFAVKMS